MIMARVKLSANDKGACKRAANTLEIALASCLIDRRLQHNIVH